MSRGHDNQLRKSSKRAVVKIRLSMSNFHDPYAPVATPSIKAAIEELSLKHVWIIYPGKEKYKLGKDITRF